MGKDIYKVKQLQDGKWLVVWPEGIRGARRQADRTVEEHESVPSATLLGQSALSGIFIGALYGLLGLGLTLCWGMLRQINLAHFALVFLGAYLTFQLAARASTRSSASRSSRRRSSSSAWRCTGCSRASRSTR